MGLAATVVASSFGKLVQPGGDGKIAASPADLAKACLLMVTNNVGSLAMLHAKAAGVKRILFAGSFLHGNKVRGARFCGVIALFQRFFYCFLAGVIAWLWFRLL